MRKNVLLALLLALPGAAWAQYRPSMSADSTANAWIKAHTTWPQVYLGIEAGTPLYWRNQIFRQGSSRFASYWNCVTVFAGVRFNRHWAAQAGFNRSVCGYSQDVYPTGTQPAVYPPITIGTTNMRGTLAALPVLVRYQAARRPAPNFQVEGFVGFTPQWQQFTSTTVLTPGGQPGTETSTHTQTVNLFATAGLSGVFNVGEGSELLLTSTLNQRFYLSGDTSNEPALAPTGSLGFRYRFGKQYRHGDY
ncbi:MAG: hypothetical protein ACRYFX_28510 [Janthinobacterium lividum]